LILAYYINCSDRRDPVQWEKVEQMVGEIF